MWVCVFSVTRKNWTNLKKKRNEQTRKEKKNNRIQCWCECVWEQYKKNASEIGIGFFVVVVVLYHVGKKQKFINLI